MADQRDGGIVWTDWTWNPVTGCSKVSQGCKNCYAERQFNRFSGDTGIYAGRQFTDVRCHEDRLDQPLRWKRPRKIFVNSMSDLFHEDVPDGFIHTVFAVMQNAHWHVFQVLTKRPDRMMDFMLGSPDNPRIGFYRDEEERQRNVWPPRNVWLGVSVEDQATANERIPPLLQTPAAIRFVSAEPLLAPVDFEAIDTVTGAFPVFREHGYSNDNTPLRISALREGKVAPPRVDWIIVGGESGPKARPMHPAWVRSIRDACTASGVPFTFKQWGEYQPVSRTDGYHELPYDDYDVTSGFGFKKVGKKRAGRMLDGREYNEFPEVK